MEEAQVGDQNVEGSIYENDLSESLREETGKP
jgi:hypothetical protein